MIRCLALALVLAWATPAAAEQVPQEGASSWGRVVALQEFIAGRYRDVVKESREVEIVRGGEELLATPDLLLVPADAIRTKRGRLVLERGDGGRVTVPERSQVRLDPEAGWMLRLGTLDILAVGPERFTVDGVVITALHADLRISRAQDGSGEVLVLDGEVVLAAPGVATVALGPGTSTTFTQQGVSATAPLAPERLDGLVERHLTPNEENRLDREPAAAHLRIHGGVSRLHDADFGRVGVAARIRLIGPLFVGLGASFGFRPVDEDLQVDAAFVLPAHVGLRAVVPLPRAFGLLLGVDFTALVGEWCAGQGCTNVPVFEPGARLLVGTTIEVHEAIGLDISLAPGVLRRRIPAGVDPDEPIVPELQLHFAFGVFFRL